MLESSRVKTGFVGTGKGVGNAVKRYFEKLNKGYDKAMKGRRIDSTSLKTNKQRLVPLRDKILKERKLPECVLNPLNTFQRDMRKNSHTVNPQEIRDVLGRADIGLPSSDLA